MSNQAKALKEVSDSEDGGFLVPSRTIDTVYKSLIPQLGKLNPHQVQAVMDVYGQYGTYLDKLQIVGAPHQSGHYTFVPNEWRSVVAAHCGYVIEKAGAALCTI